MATIANYDSHAGYYAQLINEQTPPEAAFMREYYRVLRAYYLSNGLYDFINLQLKAAKTSNDSIKPIRNPAWRVVEFYASKLFPGKLPQALQLDTENARLQEPIEQLWRWSNFSALKQRWARWFAIYGDWFIKIATKGDPVDTVYMSLILPEHVTEFETDERGFLTWIRIDIPYLDDEGDEWVHTETWDKPAQLMTIWRHKSGLDKKLSELGTPEFQDGFQNLHGDDFIPIVYQPFRDDGGGRGSGAYSAQLDKIDEANRQATRLAQILFRHNRPIWAATNAGTDASGRPLPPINLAGLENGDGEIMIGDDSVLALPGMSDLKPLVPSLNYGDALMVLESMMTEVSHDLPELVYYDLREMGELSGRAVKYLLDDMISRVVEARGNAETALARAHAMAITIGQNLGVWSGIGDYNSGQLEHSFVERPVLPKDILQMAQTIQTLAASGATLFAAGKAAGMSDEEANELADVGLGGLFAEQELGGR